ncbi:MAG TPA: hypothetical protein VIC71_08185 [Gammaproteobacteria bacterium]|jgi:hypothetical protein
MEIIPTSGPHWHLLLNHFPAIGTVLAMGLLLCAQFRKSEELNRASLILFVIIALLAIPTYISGGAARRAIEGTADISSDLIAAHQDAATWAFAVLLITGWVSWFAVWQYRRLGRPYPWVVPAVIVLGLITLAAMVRTGSLGGAINHPEVHEGEAFAAGAAATGIAAWIQNRIIDSPVVWPTLEALHFTGMALLFGVVLLVLIRVLGIVKTMSFAAIHRLLPLGVFGLVINVVTGMLFFVADYSRYVTMTNSFFPKMALIVIGGVCVLYFTIFEKPWALKAGEDAPLMAKVMAVATVLMWAGVITYGRLLPYLEGEGG